MKYPFGLAVVLAALASSASLSPALGPDGRPSSSTPVEDASADDERAGGDSSLAFPAKIPSHSRWEKAASLPGRLLYLPFWALFQVAGGAIALNEEYSIVPRTADLLTADDGSYGVFPLYSPRSGGGLTYYRKHPLGERSRFDATASWGVRRRQLYQARLRRVDLFGGLLQAGGRLQYRRMSDESFFGIGPDSREGDETNFSLKRSIGEVAVGRGSGDRFKAGVIIGIEHNIVGEGKDDSTPSTTDRFTEASLPGLEREAAFARFTLGVYYDGRDRPVRPTSGVEGELRGRIAHQVNDDRFAYSMVVTDVSGYVPLFRDRVLYVRAAGVFVDPFPARTTPFYALAGLGATETIRGFDRGRFRDRDAVLATVEYRYPIRRLVDALLFVDAGHVAGSIFDDFRKDDVQYTYGGGFRVWHKGGTLLRLELGKSDDGYRVHFLLNPSPRARKAYTYF